MKQHMCVALTALLTSSCASSTVMPVAQDTVIISTTAEMACGRGATAKLAAQKAAVETIRRGYDKFIIVGAGAQSDIRQVGTTPVYAHTAVSGYSSGSLYGNRYSGTYNGFGNTTVYGGQPIYDGSHNQQLAVKMFKQSDPGSENALDARTELGPDWEKKIAKDKQTCL